MEIIVSNVRSSLVKVTSHSVRFNMMAEVLNVDEITYNDL